MQNNCIIIMRSYISFKSGVQLNKLNKQLNKQINRLTFNNVQAFDTVNI